MFDGNGEQSPGKVRLGKRKKEEERSEKKIFFDIQEQPGRFELKDKDVSLGFQFF